MDCQLDDLSNDIRDYAYVGGDDLIFLDDYDNKKEEIKLLDEQFKLLIDQRKLFDEDVQAFEEKKKKFDEMEKEFSEKIKIFDQEKKKFDELKQQASVASNNDDVLWQSMNQMIRRKNVMSHNYLISQNKKNN
ncbi:MAG: hypothetical protein Edafosvirus6_13 [Edafosvirus sp.]|uniref:Uncharacterized protein n=1 Tax=Edafosvirus sp. TaxID=2487765 RepID=A0A3G4ZV10_9VIRU|nr:MAG: hypothetical protein Edafosvirus6_13 [Edafosvirus sp.]